MPDLGCLSTNCKRRERGWVKWIYPVLSEHQHTCLKGEIIKQVFNKPVITTPAGKWSPECLYPSGSSEYSDKSICFLFIHAYVQRAPLLNARSN